MKREAKVWLSEPETRWLIGFNTLHRYLSLCWTEGVFHHVCSLVDHRLAQSLLLLTQGGS